MQYNILLKQISGGKITVMVATEILPFQKKKENWSYICVHRESHKVDQEQSLWNLQKEKKQ